MALDMLLVAPPSVAAKPYDKDGGMTLPLGLGYLAAVLEQAGYSVELLDMAAEHLHNGRALYESTGPSGGVPEALQVIDWARLCELGRIQGGLVYPRHLVKSLPPGRYYWAVQSIDSSFAGSPFTEMAERIFFTAASCSEVS